MCGCVCMCVCVCIRMCFMCVCVYVYRVHVHLHRRAGCTCCKRSPHTLGLCRFQCSDIRACWLLVARRKSHRMDSKRWGGSGIRKSGRRSSGRPLLAPPPANNVSGNVSVSTSFPSHICLYVWCVYRTWLKRMNTSGSSLFSSLIASRSTLYCRSPLVLTRTYVRVISDIWYICIICT